MSPTTPGLEKTHWVDRAEDLDHEADSVRDDEHVAGVSHGLAGKRDRRSAASSARGQATGQPVSRARAGGDRAPIEAGWSTTTSTVPCSACRSPKTSRSFGPLLGSHLSKTSFPAGVTAVAWCSPRPRRSRGYGCGDRCRGTAGRGDGRRTHVIDISGTGACDDAGGHAPDQRSVDASGAGDTTRQDMRSNAVALVVVPPVVQRDNGRRGPAAGELAESFAAERCDAQLDSSWTVA